VLGTFHHTPATVRQALDLLATGAVPASPFLQERAPLSALPDLLARLARGGGPLKVVVEPW
jgi:threonine dehydrogenase-like Zn-dependent dehydrogenase